MPEAALRILVVGGSGSFGSRLVRGLAATTPFAVIIAGRNLARSQALAEEMGESYPSGRFEAAVLDTASADAEAIRALTPFAVVDAAGPFQGADFKLARAAIAAGAHYVDIADARDFVAAFSQFDGDAKAAGVTALTGASSTPALSNAALDAITSGWQAVDTVEIAITPGNRAPRGLSVIQAILSYAGKPVRLLLDGAWQARPGWGLLARRRIGGIGPRWLSLCETPDLDIVPERFGVRRSAIFRAGLELPLLHLGLAAAAVPVRLRLLPSLRPFSELFQTLASWCSSFGSDRGGMVVEARGIDGEGRAAFSRWSLTAQAGDGPNIPVLPALAALRMLAKGGTAPGARPCVGMLDLAQIEAEFRPYRIATMIETEADEAAPLFAAALGEHFHAMPEAVRAAHAVKGWHAMEGMASITGAQGMMGKFIARLFGFPPSLPSVPVKVQMECRNGTERWRRDFGGRRFASVLTAKSGGGLEERFGPFSFALDITAGSQGLSMDVRGWRLGPLPLPRLLVPRSIATETVDDEGRFRFDVEIALPVIGRLVHYRGWLEPVSKKQETPAEPALSCGP